MAESGWTQAHHNYSAGSFTYPPTCSAKILHYICSYMSNIDKAPFLHHSNYPVTPQIHLCCFLLLNTPSPVLLPFSPPPLPLVANSNAFNNQPQNCLSLPSAQKCHFCNKGTQTTQSLPHQRPAFSWVTTHLPGPVETPFPSCLPVPQVTAGELSLHPSKTATFQCQQSAMGKRLNQICCLLLNSQFAAALTRFHEWQELYLSYKQIGSPKWEN